MPYLAKFVFLTLYLLRFVDVMDPQELLRTNSTVHPCKGSMNPKVSCLDNVLKHVVVQPSSCYHQP